MKLLADMLMSKQMPGGWIFVVVKPGFTGLCKDIVKRFENYGFKLERTRPKQLLLREAHSLYIVHKKEDFYEDLCEYMASDISIGMIFSYKGKSDKKMFEEAGRIKEKIRKKWGKDEMRNVIHSSDSLSAMERESQIYF